MSFDEQEGARARNIQVGLMCGGAVFVLAGVALVVAGQASGTRSPDATTLAYLGLGACPAFCLASLVATAVMTFRAHVLRRRDRR